MDARIGPESYWQFSRYLYALALLYAWPVILITVYAKHSLSAACYRAYGNVYTRRMYPASRELTTPRGTSVCYFQFWY